MADTVISIAAAIDACDAITSLIDVGGAGILRIYDGTKPADVSVAPTGTILAELPLSATAFGGAVDAGPNAVATANTVTADSNANASGDASHFRVFSGGGTAIIDGDVTATGGGGDMELNSIAIAVGAQVSITSWTFTVPEQAP